jgi:hypothetical protein
MGADRRTADDMKYDLTLLLFVVLCKMWALKRE